jgi:hypothetical protein
VDVVSGILEEAMKIAVYSNFYGSDAVSSANVNAKAVQRDYPHFFFTNNGTVAQRMTRAGWTVVQTPEAISGDPMIGNIQSKAVKVRPWTQNALDGYDILIYRDAKMQGLDFSMLPKILERMKAKNCWAAYVVHPRGVVAEVAESMMQPRYAQARGVISNYVEDQLEAGWAARMLIHFGCNISVRDMHHPDTRPAGELWAQHIGVCGVQDQISFHFIAQHYPLILPIPGEFGFRRSEVPVPDWT